jgi:hypothetical protein
MKFFILNFDHVVLASLLCLLFSPSAQVQSKDNWSVSCIKCSLQSFGEFMK